MPDGTAQIILAIDFGLRRVGLASGDTLTRTAAPRKTLAVTAAGFDWPSLAREVEALRPAQIVVGEPYNADGSPSELTAAARAFAAELRTRFALPVHLVDERWSSLDAEERLRESRATGARRRRVAKEDIDAVAAAVILERWFEAPGARNRTDTNN
jgi:putative Holliday junction resolvase